MDRTSFEAWLKADGYGEAMHRRIEAGQAAPDHAHPFDARLLILEGEFVLEHNGNTRRYGPGDAFEVPANEPHGESFGPEGATYLVGRRMVE